MPFYKLTCLLLFAAVLSSCAAPATTPTLFPTYDPFLPIEKDTRTPQIHFTTTPTSSPTATREPTPTRVPLTISPIPTGVTEQPAFTPTPDELRILPTPRQDSVQYIVQ